MVRLDEVERRLTTIVDEASFRIRQYA